MFQHDHLMMRNRHSHLLLDLGTISESLELHRSIRSGTVFVYINQVVG
jgi:hypothetical protein